MNRVLIVEDSQLAARAYSSMVESLGYDAFVVATGCDAVKATGDLRPEVILMDLVLPDIDGCEAARRIRELDLDWVPTIIAISASGRSEDMKRTQSAGMTYHLVKPLSVELLQTALDSLSNPLH